MSTNMTACGDCGMPCGDKEYHPFAACLMFKACHDSRTVRANLAGVVDHGFSRASKASADVAAVAIEAAIAGERERIAKLVEPTDFMWQSGAQTAALIRRSGT